MKKLIILLYSTFLMLNSTFSSGQQILWQKTIGGSSLDGVRRLIKTTDGGYIIGGVSISNASGDKTENNLDTTGQVYSYDLWLVKVNVSGNIVWENTIGGYCSDTFGDIIQTTDGGYLCSGNSKSPIGGDKSENNRDATLITTDYWLLKLDANGNIQWQKTYGGNNWDNAMAVASTPDGGFIVGGQSGSNISGDKTENTCNGTQSYDYWVLKLDSAGSIQWQNNFGGNDNDLMTVIRTTSDGGYICGGYSRSTIDCDKTEDPIAFFKDDYWVVKLDAVGNIIWQNTFGGSDNDKLTDLIQTADGGYICVGESTSNASGDKTENSFGNSDYWVVKLDAVGTIEWQNNIGGDNYDSPHSIIQTFDGGYAVGGFSYSGISGDKNDSCRGGSDYWFIKLSATGNIQWQNTLGGTMTDNLFAIEQAPTGDFILGGESNSSNTGEKTDSTHGDYDYWILKLNSEYNLITGKLFADVNSNGIQDVGEPDLPNKMIIEATTSNISFSEQNGNYSIALADTGNFSVSSSTLNYFMATPATQSAYFASTLQTDSLNDFKYQPTGTFNDLCITITPLGIFRPGFDTYYVINYENTGTTILNGTVMFFPDTNLSYVSSSITPVSINADSIEFNLGSLIPFQSGSFMVVFNVSSGAPLGIPASSVVQIEPLINDANPACNIAAATVIITGSFDPNDILVSEDTLLTTQFPNPPFLDYTIRFQNTGTDTAFTVMVSNPIDISRLELSSIEFVNSSHPVTLKWIPLQRNMEFKFNNILLPDSNINEPLSHGFVHYHIKPKTTLLAGDSITNNAYIYFDFNAPVATNTAITRILLPTGIAPLSWGEGPGVRCFPNPAKDEITIAGYTLQHNQPAVLKIFDVMGKEVFSQLLNRTSQIVNLKSFSKGVYFVQVQTGAKVSRVKFVKQ